MSTVVAIVCMSLDVDVAAVLLGDGVRLFDHLAGTPAVLGGPTVIAASASRARAPRCTGRRPPLALQPTDAHCSDVHPRTLGGAMVLAVPVVIGAMLAIGATDSTRLGCEARGSREWLATRASPLDSAVVVVGGTTVQVCYSRPHARGRSVDSLVPLGRAWRTGANEPTTVTLSAPATIGGAALAAGRYVLLTVPGAERWTLAFHTTPETEPGRMFATLRPVAQGTGRVERSPEMVEQFTIRAETTGDVAALVLEWGDRRVRVPVTAGP